MKRSTINAAIDEALVLLRRHCFELPPFSRWTPAEWRTKGPEIRGVLDRRLGWDVTEFGLDRFDEFGLVLFTLRNGSLDDLRRGAGMLYAEKALIVGVEQKTPMHFHWSKTEDIINRGGGSLAVRLYRATEEETLDTEGDVTFLSDGVTYTQPAGSVFRLATGASITLVPGLYHSFWAEKSPVLAGEVSTVNDDENDNRFLDPIGRFPDIEEDESARYLLVSEYCDLSNRQNGNGSE
jgi:D-lyxose ketol-isomerase